MILTTDTSARAILKVQIPYLTEGMLNATKMHHRNKYVLDKQIQSFYLLAQLSLSSHLVMSLQKHCPKREIIIFVANCHENKLRLTIAQSADYWQQFSISGT